ncbi:hypothetical protein C0993_011787 [Termitomyces sp. T159_Od127]|nr:hypothetical protein C0993_011787 [Termitomyces sp. T159_Od127]
MDVGRQRGVLSSTVKGWSMNVNVTGVEGQQSASRVRSYGTTKRAVSENDREAWCTGVKKAKVSQVTTLVTKAHASASGLSKPFKTPFKTPFIEKATSPQFPPPVTLPRCEEATETSGKYPVKKADDQQNTVIKVDVGRRQECAGAFNNIRRALYNVLMLQNDETWNVLGAAHIDVEAK